MSRDHPPPGGSAAGPWRVALLGHRLAAPDATGVGRYYRDLATALGAAADPGVLRYVMASTREPGAGPPWVAPPLEHATLGGPRRVVHAAWCAFHRPFVDRAPRGGAGATLGRTLGRVDLVHTLHPWAPTPTRAPLIVTVHDVMPLVHPEWHRRDEGFGLRRGIAYARDHASLIIVASRWTAVELRRHAGVEEARVRVVPEGVGAEFRQRPDETTIAATCRAYGVEAGRYLIAVGAVVDRKNLVTVVRALARVAPGVLAPGALLLVGPAGRGARAVREEVDRLGLGSRIRFAGYVPGPELPALLAGALALVHPSLDEGFGLTPLEAMAAGTATLVSTAGSLPEVVGDGAVLVDPTDPDAWAAAIEAVATDPEHRRRLVVAGRRRQERFTWQAAALATMAAHLEVLGP